MANHNVVCHVFVLAVCLIVADSLMVVNASESKDNVPYGSSLADEMDGLELDFQSHRRILANDSTSGVISYAALLKNSVPCSVAGASYYNCRMGAEANPYTRSCSAITRCAKE